MKTIGILDLGRTETRREGSNEGCANQTYKIGEVRIPYCCVDYNDCLNYRLIMNMLNANNLVLSLRNVFLWY